LTHSDWGVPSTGMSTWRSGGVGRSTSRWGLETPVGAAAVAVSRAVGSTCSGGGGGGGGGGGRRGREASLSESLLGVLVRSV
jgi:hypothetical protein